MGHGGHEFDKPGYFVPGGAGIDQQWRVAFEHPFQALEDGGPAGPDFGVRRRELPAVGKRDFHGSVAMALEQGHGKAAFGQGVGGGHTGDTATNDCDCFHEKWPFKTPKDGALACKSQVWRAPSVFGPERFTSRWVRLACSFGAAQHADALAVSPDHTSTQGRV